MIPSPTMFTVFTPTYNRAHTLPRVYESLLKQTESDFDWLIVDDGSSDNTRELVEEWQRSAPFKIEYHYQENQGKHVAHNTALAYARGLFTVILDSDDVLVPNALERLRYYWESIPEARRKEFAVIEGLATFFDGEVEGDRFPESPLESDFIETRERQGIRGDKKGAILTEVMKKFPFPQFSGERHVRPSLLMKRIAQEYKSLYVNEVIQLKELQPGGLSSDRFRLRMRNPQGFRFYYKEQIGRVNRDRRFSAEHDTYCKYIRYSLHCGVGGLSQISEVPSLFHWVLALPVGYAWYFRDRVRLKRLGLSDS